MATAGESSEFKKTEFRGCSGDGRTSFPSGNYSPIFTAFILRKGDSGGVVGMLV